MKNKLKSIVFIFTVCPNPHYASYDKKNALSRIRRQATRQLADRIMRCTAQQTETDKKI